MFINYNPNTGVSINSYRQAQGSYGELGNVLEAIEKDKWCCCDLAGAVDLLQDGHYWQGSDFSSETLEDLLQIILDWEAEQN